MAKQKGPLKIVGSLEDINFYKLKKGYAVRMKGGVDKDRILNEARFARTRENMSEFGHCATSGKYLRKAASSLSLTAKDGTSVARLTKVMSEIKNMDGTSLRGRRRVDVGIQTAMGLAKLKGFEFNAEAPISIVLNAPFTVDTTTGEIEIPALQTAKNLSLPPSATHVSLMAAYTIIDFASGDFNTSESPILNVPIDLSVNTVTLTPSAPPIGTGVSLFFLGIQYFQEINGFQYPLADDSFNTLSIVAAS